MAHVSPTYVAAHCKIVANNGGAATLWSLLPGSRGECAFEPWIAASAAPEKNARKRAEHPFSANHIC